MADNDGDDDRHNLGALLVRLFVGGFDHASEGESMGHTAQANNS